MRNPWIRGMLWSDGETLSLFRFIFWRFYVWSRNLLSAVPGLVPWICGGFFVSNPSLSRFFIFHFLLPFIIYILIFIHIFYLHQVSSNNPLGYNINNKITFFPFFISKDLFSFFNIGFFSILEIFFSLISLSHPDNAFEVSVLVTPLHIVPEWYFLEFYHLDVYCVRSYLTISIKPTVNNRYFINIFSKIYISWNHLPATL